MRYATLTPEETMARRKCKKRHWARVNEGARLAASLRPLRSSAEVAAMLGCSPQYVIEVQNKALWKIGMRMRELAQGGLV